MSPKSLSECDSSVDSSIKTPPGFENTRRLEIPNSGKKAIEHIVVAVVTGHISLNSAVPWVCR